MTPDRKHPTVAFWIIVALLAVQVGYPLSIGPAYWLTSRSDSLIVADLFRAIYRPLCVLAKKSDAGSRAMSWYLRLLAPEVPDKIR